MAKMKIACTSDLHGHLPEIPDCDLLVIAGDICPATNHSVKFQEKWLLTKFKDWLLKVNKPTIITPGNHDFYWEKYMSALPCANLIDAMTEFQGLKFWGCPHTKTFFNWAFMLDEDELKVHHEQIPKADVLIMHSPPYGFGDRVPRGNGMIEHTGSPALTDYIVKNEPKLVVFGHIHCDPGVRTLGNTVIANVTLADESYRMAYPPKVFEVQ